MPLFRSPQLQLRISAKPAFLTRTESYLLRPVLALLVAIAALTPVGNQSAAGASAKATEPTRFTVAAPPPEGENAYCDKGNVARFGAKDGPAELPQTCYYTGLDGTPSPGKQIRVAANSDLAEAIAGAKCGDTLLLAASASFPIKQFPGKNCDDGHYITVRTDTPDAKLPPEGTRISPAWGGVASLPGRPPYAQPAAGAAKLMATIVVKPEIGVQLGDHYRFIGIEWVPLEGRKIARLVFTSGANHVILDRNWVHGTDGVELGHGFGIKDSSYVAVIHSYFNSFTCTAGTGSCTDATAVGGGNGDLPTHALKIVDNFLEASGENILFGGAPSNVRPEDIEIRRNHMFKPMFWNRNSPDHREPTPIVKNLFELKNAHRVLLEGDYLENSWGGFSQVGAAILLTPRNNLNRITGEVKCPDCAVADVTIRYVWVRKANQVLQIENPMDKIKPAPGHSYSIHDIVAEGLGYPECGKACGGALNHLAGPPGTAPKDSTMYDVAVDHITYISMKVPNDLMIMGGPPQKDPNDPPRMYNITFTNTIADVGAYGMWPMGGKPERNCSSFPGATPKSRIEACWKGNSAFVGNVLAGGTGIHGQAPVWPEGNPIAGSLESVGFVNLNHGLDGDYHLAAKSKLKGKATDGRDPGADVDAVLAGIHGVR